jgi:hypothetical protein
MQHGAAGDPCGTGYLGGSDIGVAQVDETTDRRLQDAVPGHGAFLGLPADIPVVTIAVSGGTL